MIGFTHCPDVCPAALGQMAALQKRLAALDAGLEVVFVSVDPERDSPAELAGYVEFFGDDVVAATGEPEQLQRFADSLDFAWVKVPQSEGRYTVDHSAALALIDPNAHLVGYFVPPLDIQGMAGDLERILGQKPVH